MQYIVKTVAPGAAAPLSRIEAKSWKEAKSYAAAFHGENPALRTTVLKINPKKHLEPCAWEMKHGVLIQTMRFIDEQMPLIPPPPP